MVPPFDAGGTCMLSDAVQLINAIHLDWNQQDVCMWCVYVLYMLRFCTHALCLFLQKTSTYLWSIIIHISFIYVLFRPYQRSKNMVTLAECPSWIASNSYLFVKVVYQCLKKRQLWVVWLIWKFKVIFVGVCFFHLRQLIPIRSNFLCDMDIFRLPWKHITTKDLPRDFGYLRTQKFVLPFPYHPGIWYTYCTYMYHKNQPNVGKYAIHGSYGSEILYTTGGNQRIWFFVPTYRITPAGKSQGKPALKLTGWHLPGWALPRGN